MKKEKTEYLPLSRSEELAVQKLAGETLIYDLQIDKAYCLNQSSAMIWNACDGTKTIAEISRQLSGELNSEITEDFVSLALEDLRRADLLANSEQLTINFGGVSRRKVIKRIGLATAVALPVISALLVPTAAEAANSCLANNSECPIGPFILLGGRLGYPYPPCCSGYCIYDDVNPPIGFACQ